MNLRESPVAIFTIITALAITIAIWFFATHRCARSHMGTCYTTTCYGSGNTRTCNSVPYECETCDEWVER
jgi:hypothetical protein